MKTFKQELKELGASIAIVPHSGALIVSAFVDPHDGHGVYLERQTYYGYDRLEAILKFHNMVLEKKWSYA